VDGLQVVESALHLDPEGLGSKVAIVRAGRAREGGTGRENGWCAAAREVRPGFEFAGDACEQGYLQMKGPAPPGWLACAETGWAGLSEAARSRGRARGGWVHHAPHYSHRVGR
jgi:hypothetical protein